jgi:hypothetical protein
MAWLVRAKVEVAAKDIRKQRKSRVQIWMILNGKPEWLNKILLINCSDVAQHTALLLKLRGQNDLVLFDSKRFAASGFWSV